MTDIFKDNGKKYSSKSKNRLYGEGLSIPIDSLPGMKEFFSQFPSNTAFKAVRAETETLPDGNLIGRFEFKEIPFMGQMEMF